MSEDKKITELEKKLKGHVKRMDVLSNLIRSNEEGIEKLEADHLSIKGIINDVKKIYKELSELKSMHEEDLNQTLKQVKALGGFSNEHAEGISELVDEIKELKERMEIQKRFYDIAERNEGKGTDWDWRVQIIDRIINYEVVLRELFEEFAMNYDSGNWTKWRDFFMKLRDKLGGEIELTPVMAKVVAETRTVPKGTSADSKPPRVRAYQYKGKPPKYENLDPAMNPSEQLPSCKHKETVSSSDPRWWYNCVDCGAHLNKDFKEVKLKKPSELNGGDKSVKHGDKDGDLPTSVKPTDTKSKPSSKWGMKPHHDDYASSASHTEGKRIIAETIHGNKLYIAEKDIEEWEKEAYQYKKEVAEPLASSASHTDLYCYCCGSHIKKEDDKFCKPCFIETQQTPEGYILVEKENLERWSKVIIRFLKKYQPTLRSLDAFKTVKELKKYLEEDKE